MHYIEAPNEFDGPEPSVFLAGGISDCEDWQARMTAMLADTDLVVLNPRRRDFPKDDPAAAEAQIRWEFRHLRRASARAFWFPPQTLYPIALYELGAWSASPGTLFVGVDPAYARRGDVQMQTLLARPNVRIVYSVQDLAAQVKRWWKGLNESAEALGCGRASHE